MDQENHPVSSNRPRFDFTITFGDVIMLVGFLIGVFIGWTNLDKRVVILEEKASFQKTIDQQQDSDTSRQFDLIRQGQNRIEAKLDRVIENKSK